MPIVCVPTAEITDWETFHDVFALSCGVPDFYGRNVDAWIDCMTWADDPARDKESSPSTGPVEVRRLPP